MRYASFRAEFHNSFDPQRRSKYSKANRALLAGGHCRGPNIDLHLFDRSLEGKGRRIVLAYGRAFIAADIKGLTSEAERNGPFDPPFTDLLVIDEKADGPSLADSPIRFEVNANRARAGRECFRTSDDVPLVRHKVVFIDGLPILDVQTESARGAAFRYQYAVSPFLRHVNRGGDGVRDVLSVDGRTFRNANGARVVNKISSSGNQAGPQTRIATFRKAIVERQNVVLLCFDPEGVLHFLQ